MPLPGGTTEKATRQRVGVVDAVVASGDVAAAGFGGRIAIPMMTSTTPRTAAIAATPKATTEVNREAWRKDAFISVARFGSVLGSSA
jgi:hypothetical protein